MILIYIHICIWNTVIHCEFMTSSHNVPSRSRKHFHLVFGIPRPLPHCPPSSNTAPDEPSPQGEQNRWLSWFGVLRIGPENLDVHRTRLFPATLNYPPQDFKRWFQMPASPTPGGHGFRPHVAKRTWMHFAYEIRVNYTSWNVFRQTQRSKHDPFSWAKWVSDSCWWQRRQRERANDKQTKSASLLLRHASGYFLLPQPNGKWLQTLNGNGKSWCGRLDIATKISVATCGWSPAFRGCRVLVLGGFPGAPVRAEDNQQPIVGGSSRIMAGQCDSQ